MSLIIIVILFEVSVFRFAIENDSTLFCCRNGTLDLLIADSPVLDYYRATDHGCKLQRIGDHPLAEDAYAIGMAKGFPLKVRVIERLL